MAHVTLSKPSAAPGISLVYITLGALLSIWSAVWYFVYPPAGRLGSLVCGGLFLSGLAFLAIGFAVGRLSRQAREAELPPAGTPILPGSPADARAQVAPAAAPAPLPQVASLPTASGVPLGATVLQTNTSSPGNT